MPICVRGSKIGIYWVFIFSMIVGAMKVNSVSRRMVLSKSKSVIIAPYWYQSERFFSIGLVSYIKNGDCKRNVLDFFDFCYYIHYTFLCELGGIFKGD